MSLTFEVQSKFMFGVRGLAVRVVQQVDSEPSLRTARAQEIVAAHPVSHAERRVPIAVVVVEHGRQDSVLPAVHEAVLGFVGGGA